MDLSNIDRVVEFCRDYRRSSGGTNPELESLLAELVAVKAAGAFEEYLETCIGLRADATEDARIANLVRSKVARSFRHPNWDAVKGQLRQLGEDLATSVEDKSTLRQRQALSSLVSHKDDAAHTSGSSITLNDALAWYEEAKPLVLLIGESILNSSSQPPTV